MNPAPLLLVFARRPRAHYVKTRLIPHLGAEGALQLYCALLRMALHAAGSVPGVTPELWWDTPAPRRTADTQAPWRPDFRQRIQPQGDLGMRMQGALTDALRRAPAAVLIGSDCPGYSAAYLCSAFTALATHDAVLGPAHDGGYVLIGLRRIDPSLFAAIPWGTGDVLAHTRTRLAALGWHWHELATQHDIDRPEDLLHYPDLAAITDALAPRTDTSEKPC